MLVVSRKQNEKVFIDGGIEIVVVAIKGNTVRLGIKAPPSIRVLRDDAKEKREK